jgi:hypothetical protein
MQGYNKVILGPSITVHYNIHLDASMLHYSKGSEWPSITVHYISYADASMLGYISSVWSLP